MRLSSATSYISGRRKCTNWRLAAGGEGSRRERPPPLTTAADGDGKRKDSMSAKKRAAPANYTCIHSASALRFVISDASAIIDVHVRMYVRRTSSIRNTSGIHALFRDEVSLRMADSRHFFLYSTFSNDLMP